jgi:hypothetical protein
MAITVQSTYLTDYVTGFPGMLANGETQNRISRTIEDAAGVAFGKAVFQGAGDHGATAAQAFTGVGTAKAGNVGTSTVTASPAVSTGAQTGRYVITQQVTSGTGSLVVSAPDGAVVATGNVGTAITTIPGIASVTVTAAGTPTAGDQFYVDVTGNVFIGVTIADGGIVPVIGGAVDTYPQYSTATLLDSGVIYVTAGSNTTPRAAVYVTSAGAFTTVSAGNSPIRATFMDTVTSGSPVRIRVRP